ncbi:hypothetical protein [Parageobacillus thermoglucosidasius]|uniref:hypothetical protein n=1 Tax=Parageobacillus thermoglucosidasius TaxID=1426 RepID=UPI0002E9A878|nr:hypothetical protein [Parageobacillus thermoglucosidasius]KYD14690.1 hypothetical protein B4168_1899 [Anoxybacillus flavithermus]REK55135.1 MAG: hypothetical protein C6P36_13720 [Geobacillus sp.]MED4904188.1 hypothetical protein [Parageobacillus thermoglucosidasius]MED4914755.1 hypothetical protein [Parageobacillus thermoglucosidasius]MED4943579.1 hypothetical protein [Parageobacillus thermoglucosidasius]
MKAIEKKQSPDHFFDFFSNLVHHKSRPAGNLNIIGKYLPVKDLAASAKNLTVLGAASIH